MSEEAVDELVDGNFDSPGAFALAVMNAPEKMQPDHLVGPEVIAMLCAQEVDEYLLIVRAVLDWKQ